MSKVFIALQTNDDTRSIIQAILADNPHAIANEQPAMVKIDAEGSLVVRRSSIEDLIGRDFDLQELHINLISLTGHVDETDDELTLSWNT
ncbi:MmoB/DmpM family protein [Zoogloea sp.]|uniref:MmoB/DmpM family protein n=1 Tax=Zoogloea sp. TaxID=49181 RepID=UPI001AC3A561|nr:MmoB/DmpM family protein [Zoogloea sp.]MBN8285055.1 MmoB/DmpM family protein [Zoogloea sp.]HPI60850.1 MmoB/DmpM family protein [Zoogloea sp.]